MHANPRRISLFRPFGYNLKQSSNHAQTRQPNALGGVPVTIMNESAGRLPTIASAGAYCGRAM